MPDTFFYIIISISLLTTLFQYWFWLKSYLLISKHHQAPSSAVKPAVSVIVCAHNEEEYLPDLLSRLAEQDYASFEVIMVNDRSTDKTAELIDYIAARDQRFRAIHLSSTAQGYNPKKYALELGIKAAQYELLLLTDADCTPASPHWISLMVDAQQPDTDIVLGYSPYKKYKGLLNLLIRFETLFTGIQYLGWALLGKPYMGVGRNLLYKKEIFLNTGGFSTIKGITGGDDDLFIGKVVAGAKTKISVSADSQTISEPFHEFKAWYRQKTRHYHAGLHYSLKHKIVSALIPGSILISYSALFVDIFYLFTGWILLIFILRTSFFVVIFVSTGKRMGETFSMPQILLADLIYPILYLFIGITAVIHPKPRWN